jgi:UDP-3-O-[3-hydroxymyristoyl] glucosamine N-acyltransferase
LASLTVHEIARLLSGSFSGDGATTISAVSPLESAEKDDLSFFAPKVGKAAHAKKFASNTRASALLVREIDPEISLPQIAVKEPYLAAVQVAAYFRPRLVPAAGVHPSAIVDSSAQIAKSASIGAYAVIGKNVKIAESAIIHPHVVIYDGAEIGERCELHAHAVVREYVVLNAGCLIQPGVVLGGDGFGYLPDPNIVHRRIPHAGSVVLEENVDIGANTTIDRATFGETRVGKNSKLDNLVMVGHNTRIGAGSILCGKVGVSGSVTIGKGVVLGGDVGVADHVSIADGARCAAKAGVTGNIKEKGDYAGHPERPVGKWRKEMVALSRLPEALKVLAILAKRAGIPMSSVERANSSSASDIDTASGK